MTIQPVTSDIAASLGLKEARGVLVNSVRQGSAADRAGLRQGDVIVGFNGEAVEDGNSLRNRVATSKPGAEITITILREGKEQQLRGTLDEFSAGESEPRAPGDNESPDGRLGVMVQPLTPEIASQTWHRPQHSRPGRNRCGCGKPRSGIRYQGDVILEANRRRVRSAEELRAVIEQSADRPVLINRRGQTIYIAVRIP